MRDPMARWLPLVLLIPLLVPGASAQDPAVYTLTVTATTAQADVSVENSAQLDFTVDFESQNPIDAQSERRFQVEVSGAPPGWTASPTPSSFQMMSGESQEITVTVSVSANAEAAEATITVTVALLSRGGNQVPGVGEVLDPEVQESATAIVTRQETATREVLEALSHWIWFVLVGILVLLVIVGKFAVDSRRNYVALRVDAKDVRVSPGKSVAVPVRVQNLHDRENTVVFHVATVGQGWSASLPVPDLALDGDAAEDLQLIIASPKSAAPGDVQNVGISAHSAQAPRRVAEAIIRVTVE